jgi:hypothetical protein
MAIAVLMLSTFFAVAAPPAFAQDDSAAALPAPAIAGTGTTNFIPIWTKSTTLGNSILFQTAGKNVGIGNTSPGSKLDVSGGAIIRGLLQLPATGNATAAAGRNSQAADFIASAFNKTIATAVNQRFRWQTEPVGNNTAFPSGKLNLLYGNGAAVPAETGVSFSTTGGLTAKRFISTIATGTAPFAVTSKTLVTNLNADFLDGLSSSAFAKLLGGNSFSGNQSITGNLGVSGTITGGLFSGNGSGLNSVNAAALGGLGPGAFALRGSDNTFTGNQTITGNFSTTGTFNFFSNPIRFTDDGVHGDLQQPILVNAVDCCDFGNRMIWAHSPGFGLWGIYYDDIHDIMRWQEDGSTFEMTLDFGNGNLDVTGAITAGTKDFKIDHPLDPQNKFLYHGSVESSEMMTIYTGNVNLDNGGEAIVSLPEWFEALNTDFRYQLTSIGAAAPNLHIHEEIANHQFSVAGGAPGMKVSWQVTAVRHDAYAKAHPLVVEVDKSVQERGHYRHPDVFGQPVLTQEQMLQQAKK